MKLFFSTLLIFTSVQLMASSADTLNNLSGSEIDLTSKIQNQKQLTLDNPFVIQLYSSWKSIVINDPNINKFFDLIINKENQSALNLLSSLVVPTKEVKLQSLIQASELYLLYQVGHFQTFTNRWIEISSSTSFLQSELAIALDQVMGNIATQLIMKNGVYLSPEIQKSLTKIEGNNFKFNNSLQALKALRTRENAVAWIGKLPENDALKMPLAQTALLHYAKDGKLGASGKILKTVIEPILNKSSNEEELSLYFMTLGRLLYQAGALSESKKYYDLIPESSSYFLKAKTEALWDHLREKDYARTKGELASLELSMFNDKFYPEAYLISAMANVMLCQFNESRSAFNRFIEVNKVWAREIDKNIKDPNAAPINKNFFIINLEKAKVSLINEKNILENQKLNPQYTNSINSQISAIDTEVKKEINSQWTNRLKILETALYKMSFVKIELISRMRQVEMHMKIANADEISQQSAAPVRNNQLSFPREKNLWGDELFNTSASIINKCVNGELKVKQQGASK